jgi:hypothetical protein
MNRVTTTVALFAVLALASCKKDEEVPPVTTPMETPMDPATAPRATVDRFSATAGTLMVRDGSNGLPAAGVAINFDQGPFITHGLGPSGNHVSYYNFDVQPTALAPIYVLFKPGATAPVEGQLNIINSIPGDAGYSDFWRVIKVNVPNDYVANLVTSYAEIISKGYTTETTSIVVNCPLVPDGSTAAMRVGGGGAGLHQGWYNDKIVHYFTFEEAMYAPNASGLMPLSPIYVTFNVNPPAGGPPSGFVTEAGTNMTHNVLGSLPGDAGYSPLWSVFVYDNADFNAVTNFDTAVSATILGAGVMNVNCPMASIN